MDKIVDDLFLLFLGVFLLSLIILMSLGISTLLFILIKAVL